MAKKLKKQRPLKRIEVSKIRPDPSPPRAVNPNGVYFNSLRESVERDGVLEPIGVFPIGEEEYQIIYGHHRHQAAKQCDMETINAVVYPKGISRFDVLNMEAAENEERQGYSMFERASVMTA